MSDCIVFKCNILNETYCLYQYLKLKQPYIEYLYFEGSGLKHLNKQSFNKLSTPTFKNIDVNILSLNEENISNANKYLSMLNLLKIALLKDIFI